MTARSNKAARRALWRIPMGLLFMIGSPLECGDIGWVIGQLTFVYVEIPAYQVCFLDMPPSIFDSVQNPVVLQTYFGLLFLEKLVTNQFLLLWRMPFLQEVGRITNFRF